MICLAVVLPLPTNKLSCFARNYRLSCLKSLFIYYAMELLLQKYKEQLEDVFDYKEKAFPKKLPELIERLKKIDLVKPIGSSFITIVNFSTQEYLFSSNGIQNCWGFFPDELIKGGTAFALSRIHPQERNLILHAIQLILKCIKEQPIHKLEKLSIQFNYRLLKADEKYATYVNDYTPLEFNRKKEPYLWLGEIRQIGENEKRPIRAIVRIQSNNGSLYKTILNIKVAEVLLKQNFTNREIQIIDCVIDGHTNHSIAKKLNISFATAKTHRKNINQKLKNKRLQQLVALSGLPL